MKSSPPGLAGGAPLGGGQKVLERDVQEGAARLCDHLAAVAELGVDVDAAAAALGDARGQREGAVDEHRPPVADEDTRGHGGEPVPGREQAGGFVERRGDETAVDDPGPGLVTLAEGDDRLMRSIPSSVGWGSRRPSGLSPQPQQAGSWCGGIASGNA